jgi:caspase domain-containing protein
MSRIVRCIGCLALGLALLGPARAAAPAAAARGRVLVLVVGNNRGLDVEYPLRFAVQDAQRFAQVMTELGDVQREDLHLLTNASKADFLEELAKVRAQATSDATLVVYFSGHGSTRAIHLEGEKLNLSELQAELEATPAHFRLLLVDACRGEARKGFQADAQPFDVALDGAVGGLVAIHSTGLGEISVESSSLRAGVFSHLFVSGLRGPADANHDDAISVSEAYDYAKTHRSDWGSPSPEMDDPKQRTPQMTLTRVRAPHSLLVLPPGGERYLIYAAGDATELVRAWSRPGASTRVALSGDHFIVYRGHGGSRAMAEVALPFGGTRALAPGDFRPRPEGQVKGAWFDEGSEGGSLRVHELGISVGGRATNESGLGPAATVSYAYGMSGWAPALGMSVSRLRDANRVNWSERNELQVSAGARYATFFDTFSTSLVGAVTLGMAHQRLISRATDSDGARRTDSSSALGYGLSIGAGLRLPLLGWLSSDIGLNASVLRFPEGSGEGASSLRSSGSLLLGVGLSTRL